MGFRDFREKIGLKPRASSINLSSAMNAGGGYGFNSNPPQQQQHQHQQNMYSIPESDFVPTPQQARQQQQHHQQQQPRSMGLGGGGGIPMAMRPGGPQSTSFEGSRSVSSGSSYSYNNPNGSTLATVGGFGSSSSTTSFATTSTGNTTASSSTSSYSNNHNHNNGGGSGGGLVAGLRNFSSGGGSSKTAAATLQKQQQQSQPQYNHHYQKQQQQQQQQQDPQITAADVRRCTKLLRQMFELHLELWTLTYTHDTDQFRRHQTRLQVDAILVDIHTMVAAWDSMPSATWTEEEYEEIKWIVRTLADLPPPPY